MSCYLTSNIESRFPMLQLCCAIPRKHSCCHGAGRRLNAILTKRLPLSVRRRFGVAATVTKCFTTLEASRPVGSRTEAQKKCEK